ncbi:LysE/ArgO family amino acid transporter [Escherichia coli]|uniref:LysE/ArgO family amino acid transporter n=1 Tax=Escherichia coli TaxID=562 RepID=UPI001CD95333|nr:LysE/ArgO family amino acid transporter [Escherichia coli]MCA2074571.1 LysE/ArgO family amino acid transporter [Escherichia coli]MCA2107184.1 LysE/ArgO family amino acid transporter [Escherichia coli]
MINSVFITGFFISAGLLVAIGAQNTFVIRQGMKREFVFTVSATCFICDFILMCVGVLGVGRLINDNVVLINSLTIAGIMFLLWYGSKSLKSAYNGESLLISGEASKKTTNIKIILTTLSFSLLNPNVWIDTVAIVGGVSSTIDASQKINYLAGALSASFLWFFSIGYLAAWLSKIFTKPLFWRLIDLLIGCYMIYMAWSLFNFLIK